MSIEGLSLSPAGNSSGRSSLQENMVHRNVAKIAVAASRRWNQFFLSLSFIANWPVPEPNLSRTKFFEPDCHLDLQDRHRDPTKRKGETHTTYSHRFLAGLIVRTRRRGCFVHRKPLEIRESIYPGDRASKLRFRSTSESRALCQVPTRGLRRELAPT